MIAKLLSLILTCVYSVKWYVCTALQALDLILLIPFYLLLRRELIKMLTDLCRSKVKITQLGNLFMPAFNTFSAIERCVIIIFVWLYFLYLKDAIPYTYLIVRIISHNTKAKITPRRSDR